MFSAPVCVALAFLFLCGAVIAACKIFERKASPVEVYDETKQKKLKCERFDD